MLYSSICGALALSLGEHDVVWQIEVEVCDRLVITDDVGEGSETVLDDVMLKCMLKGVLVARCVVIAWKIVCVS